MPGYLKMQNLALLSLMDAYKDLYAGTDLISSIQALIVSNDQKGRDINEFIDHIPDAWIQQCIRLYQKKKDWGDVCKAVYGYRDTHMCMKQVQRYLKKTDFEKLT